MRPRHRSTKEKFPLMQPLTSLGWRRMLQISEEHGENMVFAKTARRLTDSMTGQTWGFELCERRSCEREPSVPGMPSATSITANEMRQFALNRPSATVALTDAQRTLRANGAYDGIRRAEYDAMELLAVKVNAHAGSRRT